MRANWTGPGAADPPIHNSPIESKVMTASVGISLELNELPAGYRVKSVWPMLWFCSRIPPIRVEMNASYILAAI